MPLRTDPVSALLIARIVVHGALEREGLDPEGVLADPVEVAPSETGWIFQLENGHALHVIDQHADDRRAVFLHQRLWPEATTTRMFSAAGRLLLAETIAHDHRVQAGVSLLPRRLERPARPELN